MWRYLLTCWVGLVLCTGVQAETFYVRLGGNDQADGRSAATAFKTVGRAGTALRHGDSLIIGPGQYDAGLLLAECYATDGASMSIIGDESGKLTGDAAGAVVIQTSTGAEPGLRLQRVHDLRVSGLTFIGPGIGLRIEESHNILVDRCSFVENLQGLSAQYVRNMRIESCVLRRCMTGIALHGVSQASIRHATIVHAISAGIMVRSCGPGMIRNCLLVDNNTSYVVDRASSAHWSSDHNVLKGTSGPWGATGPQVCAADVFSITAQERHSVLRSPAFVSADDLHIRAEVAWAGGLPGQTVGAGMDAAATSDRDGKLFNVRDGKVCVGAYAYPEPVAADGWQKLAVKLPAGGPRQSAAIYRPAGTLVATLLADDCGVSDLWWNGLDDEGQAVPAGELQIRSAVHDVRLVDDVPVGDNGNFLASTNPQQVVRLATLPDGGFTAVSQYDETGYSFRQYNGQGQGIAASAAPEEQTYHWGAAAHGQSLIVGYHESVNCRLLRKSPAGVGELFAAGADSYPVLSAAEVAADATKKLRPKGLAVVGNTAYISIPALNLVRAIDLNTGKAQGDWSLQGVGDIAADEHGMLWVTMGKDVVSLDTAGRPARRYPLAVAEAYALAAGAKRLAVVDRLGCQVQVLEADSGKQIALLGKDRRNGQWMPVGIDTLRLPTCATFLPDGRLVIAEQYRIRTIWPESRTIQHDQLGNMMETMVAHPTSPEYAYGGMGVFHIDHQSGAWRWVREAPIQLKGMDDRYPGPIFKDGVIDTGPWVSEPFTGPGRVIMLAGKPFLFFQEFVRVYDGAGKLILGTARVSFYDISTPAEPKFAGQFYDMKVEDGKLVHFAKVRPLPLNNTQTLDVMPNGDLVGMNNHNGTQMRRIAFLGFDDRGWPQFDWGNAQVIGHPSDKLPAKFTIWCGNSATDGKHDAIYCLAGTATHNQAVMFWGTASPGLGRLTADGMPRWFARSSNSNYMAIEALHDGKMTWVIGAQMNGPMDLFDEDGLRLATGAFGPASNYVGGMIDLQYGVTLYQRPDGKIGVLEEDDGWGRNLRLRVEGADTLNRSTQSMKWSGAAQAGQSTDGLTAVQKALQRAIRIPRVQPLTVDGNWTAWQKAAIAPQILAMPCHYGFIRALPTDLLESLRGGVMIGAVAHDGENIYLYTLAADSSPLFLAETAADIWRYDGLELWLEEEQFTLGLIKGDKAGIFKHRNHDRQGNSYKGRYALPDDAVWAAVVPDLSNHPLGKLLEAAAGASFAGRPGYAVMAKIPMAEVCMVGGFADIPFAPANKPRAAITGQSGQLLRLGLTLDGIEARRTQDYQISWPCGLRYGALDTFSVGVLE